MQLDLRSCIPTPTHKLLKPIDKKSDTIYVVNANLHCFIILTKRTGIIVTLACLSKADPVLISSGLLIIQVCETLNFNFIKLT